MIEERMVEGVRCSDSFGMIKLKHFVEEVESLFVMYLANFSPGNPLFAEVFGDQTPISKPERHFLDGV